MNLSPEAQKYFAERPYIPIYVDPDGNVWEQAKDPWHPDAFEGGIELICSTNAPPRRTVWILLDYWGNEIGTRYDDPEGFNTRMKLHELPKRRLGAEPPATCPSCDKPMAYEGRHVHKGQDGGHSLWRCAAHGGVICPDPPIFPEPDHRALTAAKEIWRDLCDRRGVKHELLRIDPDVQETIIQTHAWLIGQAFNTI